MKAIKGIPLWALVLGLLFLGNLGWISWNLHHYTEIRAAGKRFRMETMHTNGASGVGLFLRVKAGQYEPIWTEFDFDHDGQPDIENYFFRGRDVFDVTLSTNLPPRYSVFFRGEGKSVTWWLDRRGSSSFTERIFYDTNGAPFKHEVWYQDAWHLVDRRNETNGIFIDGEWHPIAFGTNETWRMRPEAKEHL